MSGFIRRYGYMPGNEVITQIEGVVIADMPPPGNITGVSTGVACLVGEFCDCSYAVVVDGSGAVTASIRPQECTSGQDVLNKFGGWDETIGDFGESDGNGFVALRNKKFARLVVAPINLASNYGFRFWRELPLCTASTNPLPVVPVSGAIVEAGREFRSGSGGRVRVASRVVFTNLTQITSGTGGATTSGTAALTKDFTVTGADFSAVVRPDGGVGIKKGDIVVLGNNNAGARQPLPSGGNYGAGTYRVAVNASASTPTVLALELMEGVAFSFVTATAIPYRIHVSSDADSAPVFVVGATTPGGYKASEAGGYSVPVRPLTDFSGGGSDGTWTANSALTPLVVPTALTGSTADPLSGLTGRTHVSATAAFTAAVHAPNVASSATVDALYQAAIEATISDTPPLSEVGIIWSARTSSTIRSALKANALAAYGSISGRMAIVRPELDDVAIATIVGDSSPGVGATRHETVVYAWPGCVTNVREAVNTRISTADGLTTVDGNLDVGFDGFVASVLSNLAPERNPGQAAEPIPTTLVPVLGLQRGISKLELNDYILLRSRGVAALRMDKTSGPIIQSGITTSLTSGEKDIARRRMAFFIEDSASRRLVAFSKLPLTTQNKDNIITELDTFLSELKGTGPANQRIKDYLIDEKSGNTQSSEAAGIFVVITRVKTVPSGDFIVLQFNVGNNVVTTTTL